LGFFEVRLIKGYEEELVFCAEGTACTKSKDKEIIFVEQKLDLCGQSVA
jgi:hypothetical protein